MVRGAAEAPRRPSAFFAVRLPRGKAPLRRRIKTEPRTHECDSELLPEAGFARREARKQKRRWTNPAQCRLRPPPSHASDLKEGAHGGTRRFPRESYIMPPMSGMP